MVAIRRAAVLDAAALARLAESTFRDTFGELNTPEDMDLHCRSSYGERLQAGEIADPAMTTLVCEEDGELVGFGQLHRGEAPASVVGEAPAEIQRI